MDYNFFSNMNKIELRAKLEALQKETYFKMTTLPKKRVHTNIGDIFQVEINDNQVKYFQYVARDLLLLNSDVIRVFRKVFLKSDLIDFDNLVKDKDCYIAHTTVSTGVKMGCWSKVDKSKIVLEVNNLFRVSIGHGEDSIENWYIWRIGDYDMKYIDKLDYESKQATIAVVSPPIVMKFIIIEGENVFSSL